MPTTQLVRMILPRPPSVNRYWRQGRGRFYIADEGKRYRQTVKKIVSLLKLKTIKGRVGISAVYFQSDNVERDLDNLWKCLLDSLQHAGVFESDSQIDDEWMVRERAAKNAKCSLWVCIREIGARKAVTKPKNFGAPVPQGEEKDTNRKIAKKVLASGIPEIQIFELKPPLEGKNGFRFVSVEWKKSALESQAGITGIIRGQSALWRTHYEESSAPIACVNIFPDYAAALAAIGYEIK